MSFIEQGHVNLQVFEYRKPGQTQPSDPSFEFMVGREPEQFLRLGLTHEVIGPDADGGPKLICVCPNGESAKAIKSALDLVSKL